MFEERTCLKFGDWGSCFCHCLWQQFCQTLIWQRFIFWHHFWTVWIILYLYIVSNYENRMYVKWSCSQNRMFTISRWNRLSMNGVWSISIMYLMDKNNLFVRFSLNLYLLQLWNLGLSSFWLRLGSIQVWLASGKWKPLLNSKYINVFL